MSSGNDRILASVDATWRDAPRVDVDLSSPPAGDGPQRYAELGVLGKGGLGEVLEVYDRDLRRTVALKRPLSARAQAVAELVREAQITAQLAHPGIPAVHTLGMGEDGRPFFTMTRLQGRSVEQLLAEEPPPPSRLLRIFLQVAYAVAFAHSRGVLHRDLKPSNVVVGSFGEVWLVDWGIAKLAGEADARPGGAVTVDHDGQTRAGAFKGTLGYAAPEQLEGDGALDERADVYALGALLYAMLAHRPPVQASNPQEAWLRSVRGDIPPLRSLVRCDPALHAVVHKALARDREARYARVTDLVGDVEAFLEGRRIEAWSEGPARRFARWYMGRSPRLQRLRFVDLDLMIGANWFVGIAMGSWLASWLTGWEPALLALAAVLWLRPLYTWLRPARDDDPLPPGFIDGGTKTGGTTRA